MMDFLASLRHYPEKTQVFWEVLCTLIVIVALCVGVILHFQTVLTVLGYATLGLTVAWAVSGFYHEFISGWPSENNQE